MKKEIIEWIKTIVLSLVIALIITTFIKPTIVKNYSMVPTLDENNFLIVNRLLYKQGTPKRGDIIVFRSPLKTAAGKDKLLIKRIIALPGEEIVIRDGNVFIDGEYLEEPYLVEDSYTEGTVDLVIPEGKIFAMGDNRENSLDSRDDILGLVDMEDVIGKAFLRLYPLNRMGFLTTYVPAKSNAITALN
ncbi:signal peptidase I [Clostridium formicaceticum]|uniref:Signal peptidase I n=1 Tax=Clostridium formicaceticum TaxID=1497 RepID=A0AAC9WFH3_9CLOT|nr:signal peptidase I [Clostridium formicaceticum]AOY76325.1 signal peptidase I [Clostridium formicaceticum]ARE86714.1 Signal peptidase I S [Clostridium formicaceticum]